nr:RNA-directed DNA polymerase, eukaryota [Tanacetum cinerariifolium]
MFVKEQVYTCDYFVALMGTWAPTSSKLLIISVYAPQELNERRDLWDYLRTFIDRWEGDTVIMGNFNEVRSEHEMFGYAFTWAHKSASKMSKLDRYLISEGVLDLFPHLSALCLYRHLSNHRPILLHETNYDYGPSPFWFFHSWFAMKGFNSFVKTTWKSLNIVEPNGLIRLKKKLQALKIAIKAWSKEANKRLNDRKINIQQNLSEVDKLIDQGKKHHIISNNFIAIYGSWVSNKAKLLMISIYAPQYISSKRMIWNFILTLIGRWDGHYMVMGDFNEVRCVEDHFSLEFNAQSANEFNSFISNSGLAEIQLEGYSFTWSLQSAKKISKLDRFFVSDGLLSLFPHLFGICLDRHLSDHRPILLREVVIDYGPSPFRSITLGSTFGISIKWYWKLGTISILMTEIRWYKLNYTFPNKLCSDEMVILESSVSRDEDTLGSDFCEAVEWFFDHSSFSRGCNSSFIALIPKNQDPKFVNDYRPISLIGGPFIINELLSWCKYKKQQAMVFKVDFVKAYDSIRWDFLEDVITAFGFGPKWCSWIRGCLHSSMASVLLNDRGVDLLYHCRIHVGNGLRTSFWKEVWIGENPLCVLFLRIYALEENKDCSVAEKLYSVSSLRRPVRGGVKNSQLILLQDHIEGMILSNMKDRWVWDLNGEGVFCVKDVRNLLDDRFLPKAPIATRWIKYVPIKLNVFAWKVHLDRLPTRVNLQHHGVLFSDPLCPICCSEDEDSAHIFFRCREMTAASGSTLTPKSIGKLGQKVQEEII